MYLVIWVPSTALQPLVWFATYIMYCVQQKYKDFGPKVHTVHTVLPKVINIFGHLGAVHSIDHCTAEQPLVWFAIYSMYCEVPDLTQ